MTNITILPTIDMTNITDTFYNRYDKYHYTSYNRYDKYHRYLHIYTSLKQAIYLRSEQEGDCCSTLSYIMERTCLNVIMMMHTLY